MLFSHIIDSPETQCNNKEVFKKNKERQKSPRFKLNNP